MIFACFDEEARAAYRAAGWRPGPGAEAPAP